MGKKTDKAGAKPKKRNKGLDRKTVIMLIVFGIAAIGIAFLSILGLKSSLLIPQRKDGSRIDVEAMRATPIVVRSREGATALHEDMRFTPIGNMVYDQEKSSQSSSVYYTNIETGASMNIIIKEEAQAYKQLLEFTEYAEEKGTNSPIEIVRQAFAEDLSKVTVFSKFSEVKRAGQIRQICGLYVASNDFSFAEINGDLYGVITYKVPYAYGIDLVHNGKLYTINFKGTDIEPITLDMIITFLQSIRFEG